MCQLCSTLFASRHGSFVTLLWQTKALSALSQDDSIRRLAANCLGNDFNHVSSELDESPFAGRDVYGIAFLNDCCPYVFLIIYADLASLSPVLCVRHAASQQRQCCCSTQFDLTPCHLLFNGYGIGF